MATNSPAAGTGGWRLAGTRSLYLRSARAQAIEWYPWGEEAFARARELNRPILLDIGASWCHWCHVMDEGTYSDDEVARILAQQFVAVKVDRDENPEVDRRYQRQVNALTGEGGWPLTAFLTPSGEAFFGGTYFPAQDGLGRPGFRRVLNEVGRLWRDEPGQIRENTQALANALSHEQPGTGRTEAPTTERFLEDVRRAALTSYDPLHGGFGVAPKFPHPTAVAFLLWDAFANGAEASAARARETLRRMADGGVYDQVGGGFHRYSVDEGWHVPHFEKMSVDNAALLSVYADASRQLDEPSFRSVVAGIAGWVRGTLEQPAGGFGASQDADNAPGDDGGYFTWSRPELKAALEPDELRLVARVFGVGSEGRMPHDPERNVLFRLMDVPEAASILSVDPAEAARTFDRSVEKLRAARARRPTPAVDPATYANLNGAFVRAFVAASVGLEAPELLASARRAADRFLSTGFAPERGVAHRVADGGATGYGHLEDQAEMAWGLTELAGATLEPRYLTAATELYALIDRHFRVDGMPLRDLAPDLYDGPELGPVAEPSFPVEDMPHLSPNAATALGLVRLAALTGDARWRTQARAVIVGARPRLERAGLYGAGLALAAGVEAMEPVRVVVEGTGEDAAALYSAARRAWHPNLWVFRGTPPAPFSVPEELAAAASAGGAARALVCWGTHCAPPITDPARLVAAIRRPAAPPATG